jgi:hypothetical protein
MAALTTAYAHDNTLNKLGVANQTAGTGLIGGHNAGSPTSAISGAGLLFPAVAAVAWMGARARSRAVQMRAG